MTYIVEPGTPCRTCGGSALVALCGREVPYGGPCILRGAHFGPCWGEDDVASDWTPAAACPTCCRCPCGSTSDGSLCRFCAVTMAPGYDPPEFDPSTHRPPRSS